MLLILSAIALVAVDTIGDRSDAVNTSCDSS